MGYRILDYMNRHRVIGCSKLLFSQWELTGYGISRPEITRLWVNSDHPPAFIAYQVQSFSIIWHLTGYRGRYNFLYCLTSDATLSLGAYSSVYI